MLGATGGNLRLGIAAWLIGGLIMVLCARTFSVMASRYQYVNGVVDYAEATVGRRYAYYVGWFLAVLYYPTLTSVLAWVPARKRFVLPGLSVACCLFMMTAACFSHRMAVVYYLAVFAAVMAPGAFFAPRHKQ